MKKNFLRATAFILCIAVLLGAFAGCTGNNKTPEPTAAPEPTEVPEVKEGFETCAIVQVPTESLPNTLDGLGVEWDPHFWRSMNKRKVTEEDWTTVTNRAKYLGIDKVRVWCMPSWYERKNDNNDPNVIDWDSRFVNFETADFKALVRQLDFCEEAGIEVTLTLWGCEASYWMACNNTGDWVTAPNDVDEYAESVSMLLQYLLNTKGYKCITGFTPMNEPNLSWKVDGGAVDQTHYITVCKAVDQRLKNDGLRDKIKLVLSDDSTNNSSWFERCTKELKGVADVYAYHTYLFNEKTTPTELYNFANNRYNIMMENDGTAIVTINEFGSNYNVGAYIQTDVDTYDRGIYYSSYAEQALSSGVTGMLHWCFFDVHYSDGEDFKMKTGLFQYADKDWATRPFYYSWGMIMKYTEKGSSIYKLEIAERDDAGNVIPYTENLSGVALKSPEGKWTYLLTNRDTEKSVKVQLVNNNEKVEGLKAHVYSEANVAACMASEDDSILIGVDENAISVIGHSTFVELQPNTFVLITNIE